MGSLSGKVALVTAAAKARGIGFGIASALADQGADLVITGRKKGQVNGAATELEKRGCRVLGVVVPEAIDDQASADVVSRALDAFGRLDCLVNCAQAAKSGVPISETTREDLLLALDTGVLSAAALMRACYPALKQTGGCIINLGSIAAQGGGLGQAALAVSKGALVSLSRVAAREWAPDGIRVNVVAALAQTGELERMSHEESELYNEFLADIPLGRLCDPVSELGATCAFLASDAASYITGQTINLSGGA